MSSFADCIKFFRVFVSNDDCILMQTGINCIQAWLTTNCMKENIGNESQYFYQDNKFSLSLIYMNVCVSV